jgi:hypothetical protein
MIPCSHTHLDTSVSSGTTSLFIMKWGTGTPKDKNEGNKREVCECDLQSL